MIDLMSDKDVFEVKRVLTLLNDFDSEQLKLAVTEGWISDKELEFVRKIQDQREIDKIKLKDLSSKQLQWLQVIAYRVLNHKKPKIQKSPA